MDKSERSRTVDGYVRIFVMGKAYQVPSNLTIMKAMEYTGYRFVRGAGCRAGFCGACSVLYRSGESYKLQAALACQKLVENDMHIANLPFTPAQPRKYDLTRLPNKKTVLIELYPEIARCLSCNTCTKACPQGLEVMEYVQAAIRGDLKLVSELSFDCIACGLCALRCPAEITPYNVAQVARRLYSRHLLPKTRALEARLKELEEKTYDSEFQKLRAMPIGELRKLYEAREIRE